MVKIKKAGGPKHDATLSPGFSTFIKTANTVSLVALPRHLAEFPSSWPFPRGDLYHWIPLLNRFDSVLDLFNEQYGLVAGPQAQPFGRKVLRTSSEGPDSQPITDDELDRLGFSEDGDRQLVEDVLVFSRLLLQNCGNRSLYSSSGHLNSLLNTTSLSLLHQTLRLAVCLAQRYHTSRQRPVGTVPQINTALLASHYNINLDNMQKLALPFARLTTLPEQGPGPGPALGTAAATTPTAKGKERASSTERGTGVTRFNANDLVTIAGRRSRGATKPTSADADGGDGSTTHAPLPGWDTSGDVLATFYPGQDPVAQTEQRRGGHQGSTANGDAQKTSQQALPGRRSSSGLSSAQTPRRKGQASHESDQSASVISPAKEKDELLREHRFGPMKVLSVASDKVMSTPIWKIMASVPPEVPQETRYELLARLRVASALSMSLQTRQQILGIRILAVVNLAYIYPEHIFHQKLLQHDTDEPRRFQLTHQLAELVHPYETAHDDALPRWLQTLALGALEALAKYRAKSADVATALNLNVNHGVLFYLTRKAIAEMTDDDGQHDTLQDEEWRDALFSLLAYLPNIGRSSGALVSAGLLPVLMEALNLRSEKAERVHPKVIDFLSVFIYDIRDPFQTLANVGGLGILSNLVAYEVGSGLERAHQGKGVPKALRNHLVDYELPFFQHQTLRRLFKFINHMMSQNGLTLDRLLRNLIDSPPLLGALCVVMNNASIFGSSVWSGTVDVMSSFIHNEPTSYAVIAESGLSQTFLEAVSGTPIGKPTDASEDDQHNVESSDGDADNSNSINNNNNEDEDGDNVENDDDDDEMDSDDNLPGAVSSSRSLHSGIGRPAMDHDAGPGNREPPPSLPGPVAVGILPSADAIAVVPSAFGAICLNPAGMRLFRRSGALTSFFEVFQSAEHVQRMQADPDLANMLGGSFDELVRHHPQLRRDVMDAVIGTVKMVCKVCEHLGRTDEARPRNTSRGHDGRSSAEATPLVLPAAREPSESGDVEMGDADAGSPRLDSTESSALAEGSKDRDETQRPSVSAFVDVLSKFLAGFFANNSVCASFIEQGGAEWLLDLAFLPNLPYDFNGQSAGQCLSRAVHKLVEQKPYLVLPSLLRLAQSAADELVAFTERTDRHAIIDSLKEPSGSSNAAADLEASPREPDVETSAADELVQRLVTLHTVCYILAEAYRHNHSNHRSSHNLFTQVNLADVYQRLLVTMGRLYRWCVVQQILLQKDVPNLWNDPSFIKEHGFVNGEVDDTFVILRSDQHSQAAASSAFTGPNSVPTSVPVGEQPPRGPDGLAAAAASSSMDTSADAEHGTKLTRFKPFRKLRYLLSYTTLNFVVFFHELGKKLVTKRLSDSHQKKSLTTVAETIADVMIDQFRVDQWSELQDDDDRHACWIFAVTSLSRLIFEVTSPDRPTPCLTVVLLAFKNRGGFDAMVRVLDAFVRATQEGRLPAGKDHRTDGEARRATKALTGIEVILNFFLHTVTPKTILEAGQAQTMTSRDRARDQPDYFSPAQFLVELKLAVLPPVETLLESTLIENVSSSAVKKLVEVLGFIFESDNDQGAFRRSESSSRRVRSPLKTWKESAERVGKLVGAGYERELAREALYRCWDNSGLAEDYCALRRRCSKVGRHPIPEGIESRPTSRSQNPTPVPATASPQQESTAPAPNGTNDEGVVVPIGQNDEPGPDYGVFMDVDSEALTQSETPDPIPSQTPQNEMDEQAAGGGAQLTMISIDDLLANPTDVSTPVLVPQHPRAGDGSQRDEPTTAPEKKEDGRTGPAVVTLDDLDDKRETIRRKIIELALDILNAHGDVTFELADLIVGSVPRSGTAADSIRTEIGETLVQSLMSLQMDDDFRPVSKKVAAYAHLLALILHNKQFFDATLKELKSHLSSLLGFIKVFPSQSVEENSPWISQVLLIFERLLSEDALPPVCVYTPSTAVVYPSTTFKVTDPPVSQDHKTAIFDAVLEVLPRVGKDPTLALSVVRILVILSRSRQLAARLGERRNLQRLFVMVKQLAGMTSGKLQSSFMLLLRHIVEDDETIKQIMRSGIHAFFDARTGSRQTESGGYLRGLSHYALRNAELFVEVSKEMVKISKYDPGQRSHVITLKVPSTPDPEEEGKNGGADDQDAKQGAGLAVDDDDDGGGGDGGSATREHAKPSETPMASKAAAPEPKIPVVDHPDGVIHYLLCELLSYKEVDDKEPPITSGESRGSEPERSAGAVEMKDAESGSNVVTRGPTGADATDKAQAPAPTTFKPDQHPIFIYRCFILQCLTELLSSYNRAKLEFINFTRKSPPHAQLSKPRSGVLSYFFHELIPIGTLSQPENIAFRKRYTTSNWAIMTIVGLCGKTGEKHVGRERYDKDDVDEPELAFVRKFVLEQALKAYRDAMASAETLDVKYAKILSMADLFNRMLIVAPSTSSSEPLPSTRYASHKSLAKLMLEKSFVSAFTSSVAEIDLNYPSAKRAIKYILRPLKILTETAVELSNSSSLSSLTEPSDEDEIPSASSISEAEAGREETPDLFRNSTLGLFEPGREADSDSDTSEGDEDELYDDEYGDEMEYEEEEVGEDNDMSEDDEGLDMEGLPGDVGLNVEVVLDEDGDDAGSGLEGSDMEDDDDDMQEDVDDMDEMDDMDEDEADEDAEEDPDNDEWESEDDDDPDYAGNVNAAEANEPSNAHAHAHESHESHLEHIVRALSGGDDETGMLEQLGSGDLGMELDHDDYMNDEMQEEEDLSEDDEDEDELEEEEEVMYAPGFDDADAEAPNLPWGWGAEVNEPVTIRGHSHTHHHHHHHHHHHQGQRLGGPWSTFSNLLREPAPPYRSHRSTGFSRGNDDGTHPLLHRGPVTAGSSFGRDDRDDSMTDWIHTLELGGRGRGATSADIPASIINNLISVIGNSQAALTGLQRQGAALHFHLTGPPRLQARDIAASLSARRASHSAGTPAFTDPAQAISFVPVATSGRWQAEARLLFGQEWSDTAQRVLGAILSVWVPPALEEEKTRKEKLAAEEARKIQKEAEERAKREREESEKQKQKEEEEQQQQQQQQQQSQQPTQNEQNENVNVGDRSAAADSPEQQTEPTETQEMGGQPESTETPAEGPMGGVEVSRPEGQADTPQAGPSSNAARVRTTIRGRELDITGMDIDPEYLDALPEELREEVLMHQIAERRSQAASSGEQPTNISREFLEALPAEIRQELLEQETQDRRRREREEARRRAAATSGAPTNAAEDMDPASVLATLEPGLRQAILMEQDDDVLAQLPQEIAAEARALGSEHRLRHRYMDQARVSRVQDSTADLRRGDAAAKKPQRRTVVQMLDKAGIATLLRLMFVPQHGTARQTLNGILRDICENKQNRIETVSMLLSILQDGSADTTAIERSFAQLSLRARQAGASKSSQTPRRLPEQLPHIVCEVSPLAVVQQCLNTLVLLVQYNPHLQTFFLTEHDAATGLKRAGSKKGKMKDSKASRYALNSLLGLLDRKLVMESPTVMEQLSALLNSATQPLGTLLRRDKEQASADPSGSDPPQPEAEGTPAPLQATASLGEAQPIDSSDIPDDQRQGAQVADNEGADAPSLEAVAELSDQKAEDPAGEASKPKKERVLSPPVVPEENLRLVVNILTARECSAKTFRDTLSTINNLSAIPESKDVFGNELLRQARSLGQSILEDLNELIDQINKAESDTDVQGVALIKFSPSTSSQAKLLRVLTALDYLFDAQRESRRGDQADESSQAASSAASKAEDVLAVLAHDPTFAALWAKLSECLTAIRYKEPNMVNLATILLPLIESLMVVCKDTTRRTPSSQLVAAMETSTSSLSKDQKPDALEELFFRFTEDHRKVLNELVRQSPKLMSGTFSLLVKNPKVLEFDNKRNYFTRRLHTRGTEARHTQPPLQLSVRRDHVFLDSFKSLYFKSAEEMKYGKMSIRFHGEEGVDAGGVTREWFQVLSRQMFNPDYALFTPVASDRTTFHPNRLSAVNPEHLMFFKFIGRIIGKALYEGRVLDCHFSRAVYKRILGKPVSVKDMETLDLDYYKSLIWMLENDITDIITETFSVETEAFGETQVIDLKENGRNIPVTDQNKQEYVRLVVECRLTGSVHEQLEQFLTGFHDIVPAELIAIFNEQELELLISGLPDIDVDDWKNNSEYHNYTASSPQIQWLWRAVRSFDKEERAKLLQFVTGTSKVPLNGFKELEGMNGFSRFNVHRDYGSKERLPSSHTCFNQLDLPEYESYDSLRSHLYTAMTAGSDYFGFA